MWWHACTQIKPTFVTEVGLPRPKRCWMRHQIFFQPDTCFPRAAPPKRVKNSKKERAMEDQQPLFHGSFAAQLFLRTAEPSHRRPNHKGALDVFN